MATIETTYVTQASVSTNEFKLADQLNDSKIIKLCIDKFLTYAQQREDAACKVFVDAFKHGKIDAQVCTFNSAATSFIFKVAKERVESGIDTEYRKTIVRYNPEDNTGAAELAAPSSKFQKCMIDMSNPDLKKSNDQVEELIKLPIILQDGDDEACAKAIEETCETLGVRGQITLACIEHMFLSKNVVGPTPLTALSIQEAKATALKKCIPEYIECAPSHQDNTTVAWCKLVVRLEKLIGASGTDMGGRNSPSHKIAVAETGIVEQVVKCLCEQFDELIERYSKPECSGCYRDIEAGQVQMQSVKYAAMELARLVKLASTILDVEGAV